MLKLTPDTLQDWLDNRLQTVARNRLATFITISARTIPGMNIRGNQWHEPDLKKKDDEFNREPFMLAHEWTKNVLFGMSYESMVNKRWADAGVQVGVMDRLTKGETDAYFQAESLWRGKGERINRYLARHTPTGMAYLVYILNVQGKAFQQRQVTPPVDRYVDLRTGKEVDYDDVAPWLKKKRASIKQRADETGKEVYPRCVKLDAGERGGKRLGLQWINIDQDSLDIEPARLLVA